MLRSPEVQAEQVMNACCSPRPRLNDELSRIAWSTCLRTIFSILSNEVICVMVACQHNVLGAACCSPAGNAWQRGTDPLHACSGARRRPERAGQNEASEQVPTQRQRRALRRSKHKTEMSRKLSHGLFQRHDDLPAACSAVDARDLVPQW
eukprot:4575213-Pleurochrysis_carterae.AAC.1